MRSRLSKSPQSRDLVTYRLRFEPVTARRLTEKKNYI